MAELIRVEEQDLDMLPSLVDVVVTTINYVDGCSTFLSTCSIVPDMSGVVLESISCKLKHTAVGESKLLKIPYRIYGNYFSLPTLFLRSVMVDRILPPHLHQLYQLTHILYTDSPNDGKNGGIFVDAPIDSPMIRLVNESLAFWDGYIYYDESNYA